MVACSSALSPRVAVLMATYNGAAHISSQIASVLWQLRVQVDIYIRDDGSTDRTIIEALEAFPGSRLYIIEDHQGPSAVPPGGAALNFYHLIASRQISAACYDWIAFSDQDDIWLPSKLDSAINDCLQTDSVAWSSSILAFWEPLAGLSLSLSMAARLQSISYLSHQGLAAPSCSALMCLSLCNILSGIVLTLLGE